MKYLILGNGAAGVSAAARLRELDNNGEILVATAEDVDAYSKIMLPDYIGGKIERKRLFIKEKAFYDEKRIQVLYSNNAKKIDPLKRLVLMENGQVQSYDKLLIAVGGKPFIPPIEGLKDVSHLSLNSISDAEAIISSVIPGKAALIVGGGLTGIEIAMALNSKGMKAIILEREARLIPGILDDKASSALRTNLEKVGISILTERTIRRLYQNREDGQSANLKKVAELSDGTVLEFSMLVISIGTRSDIEIAEASSIEYRRGIIVNDRLETKAENIYAAGDVCELEKPSGKGYVSSYIWPNAMSQGKCAATNMTGKEELYSGFATAQSLVQLRDFPFASMGLANPVDEGYKIVSSFDSSAGIYKKVVIQDNKVKGMIMVGDTSESRKITSLIKNGTHVVDFSFEK